MKKIALFFRWFWPVLVWIGLVALAFFVRVDDYAHYKANPQICFFQNKPLLSALDGTYYMRYARDLVEGVYTRHDPLRHFERRMPPPLMSSLAAGITLLTGWPIEKVAFYLPAWLGVLLIFPVYGFGSLCGDRLCGWIAAAIAAVAPYFVYRSGMGWFDTDCMNVTWAMTTAYLFACFGLNKTLWRYVFLFLGWLTVGLFVWWWDMAPKEAFLIGAMPFGLAVVLFYRPRRWEWVFVGLALVVIVAVVWVKWPAVRSLTHEVSKRIVSRYHFLAATQRGNAPALNVGTSEQLNTSLTFIKDSMTRSWFSFGLALIGLVGMAIKKFRVFLMLSSLMALSLLAILFAQRFVIFLTPLIGLGLGFVISYGWQTASGAGQTAEDDENRQSEIRNPKMNGPQLNRKARNRIVRGRMLAGLSAAALAWTLFWPLHTLITRITVWPKTEAYRIEGLDLLSRHTPSNAVVWAWWDLGYGIQYWGRRKSLFDGEIHGGKLTVYNGIPLAERSERGAANFMCFTATYGVRFVDRLLKACAMERKQGMAFIRQVFAAGPTGGYALLNKTKLHKVHPWHYKTAKQWIRAFYPDKVRPTYLFLDKFTMDVAYWWYWFGTWDPETHQTKHPMYIPFYGVKMTNEVVTGDRELRFEVSSGIASYRQGAKVVQVPVHTLFVRTPTEAQIMRNNRPGAELNVNLEHGFAVLMEPEMGETLFNRLFVRRDPRIKHFKLVVDNAPFFQIWHVGAERFDPKMAEGL